jgi:energy-coupling factor transporter ATP-binding protein EcfA2
VPDAAEEPEKYDDGQDDLLKRRAAALAGSVQRLATALDGLGPEHRGNLRQSCADVLRPLLVGQALDGGNFIAVAGPQGVGKTTLVRDMYGLRTWLTPNENQGERMPVFIVEDEVDEPRMRLVTATGLTSPADPEAAVPGDLSGDMARFRSALRGDERRVLYPELRVPIRYFPGEVAGRSGFLLLPGYEKVNEFSSATNRFWQALMQEALGGSAAVMLVVRPETLANVSAIEIIRDIRARHLPTTSPMIVVNCDRDPADDPDLERDSRLKAADVFGCPPDAVVFVWRRGISLDTTQLAKALESGGPERARSAAARWVELGRQVRDNLGVVIDQARTAMDAADHTAWNAQNQGILERYLGPYDEAVDQMRRTLADRLEDLENSVLGAAIERAEDLISNEEKFQTVVDALRDQFESRPAAAAAARRKLLEQSWHGDDPSRPSRIAAAVPGLLDRLTGDRLAIAGVPRLFDGIGVRLPAVTTTAVEERERDTAAAISRLLTGDSDGRIEEDDRMESAARLLPALALQWSAFAARLPQAVGLDPATMRPVDPASGEAMVREFVTNLATATAMQKQVVESLARIAGLEDAQAIAGVAGLIGALRAGKTVEAVGAAAVRVAAGLAAVTALYTVYDLTRRTRRRNLELVRSALRAIADRDRELRMAAFDQLMDHTRQVLEAAARRAYGLDAAFGQTDRLARALGDVSRDRSHFLGALGDSGIDLG